MTAAVRADAYRPVPVEVEVVAGYRGRCARCGEWWRPGERVGKTAARQYICCSCVPVAEQVRVDRFELWESISTRRSGARNACSLPVICESA